MLSAAGEIFEILADDGPAIVHVLPFPADRLGFLGQSLLLGAEAVLFRREVSLALGRSNRRLVEIVSGVREGDLLSAIDLARSEPARSRGPMEAGL